MSGRSLYAPEPIRIIHPHFHGNLFRSREYTSEERAEREERDRRLAKYQKRVAAQQQSIKEHRGIKRNDPCLCGSGQKYKKCCISQTFPPKYSDL